MNPPLLSMRGIGKQFGKVRVLRDVRFDLLAGETHVLAGENGAGKSTLIKILAGVHPEFEGEIQMEGAKVRFASPFVAARAGISVIHQELSVIPKMNVVDNIFLGREKTKKFSWMDYQGERAFAEKFLPQLGLDLNLDKPIDQYSLPIRQMIEIAKAMVFDCKIMVMDEPTSALTDVEVERLFDLIQELKNRGVGVIYISHKMDEIYRVADRLTVLRDGRWIGTETKENLPDTKLIQWMVGRKVDNRFVRHKVKAGDVALRVKNFTVKGSPRPLVDQACFELRSGEILGLAGLEGSGASDLVNGLFGTFGDRAQGEVTLWGEPFDLGSPARSIKEGLALLTNDRKTTGLAPEMSVTHNATLASLKRFSPMGWLRPGLEIRTVEKEKKRLNLQVASLDQAVNTLSGGNQQKVVLAKWLQTEPRVILLDDPTRGVDVGAKSEIYKLLNDLTKQGMAILLVSTEMPELLAMSDRILVMHQGVIQEEFLQDQATQEKILSAAMGH